MYVCECVCMRVWRYSKRHTLKIYFCINGKKIYVCVCTFMCVCMCVAAHLHWDRHGTQDEMGQASVPRVPVTFVDGTSPIKSSVTSDTRVHVTF